MNGFCAIISEPIFDLKEKVTDMLEWSGSQLYEKASDPFYFVDKTIAIGATDNLQIFENKEKTHFCIFSGTLFNKKKIHESSKEAEIALWLFLKHGEKSFEALDGEFVLLIYDRKQKELIAARDRLGTYSLYWYQTSDLFLLATSMKALLATGLVPPSPDSAQLSCYFALGFISQDATPIQDVIRLLPGYYIKRSVEKKLKIESFWSFSSKFSKHDFISIDFTQSIYKEISHKIDEANQKRQSSNSALLQGELGSYLLYEKLHEKTKNIYSQNFSFSPDHSDDETLSAADFLESLIPIVWAQEMPIADIDSVRTYYFLQQAKKSGKTPFFDTGFRQEFDFYPVPDQSEKKRSSIFDPLFSFLFSCMPKAALEMLKKSQVAKPQVAFFEKIQLMQKKEHAFCTGTLGPLFDTNLFIHQFYHLPRMPTLSASLFYLTMKTEVIDKVHDARSRLAQNFGIMSQSPFLDVELLEYLASLNPLIWASPDMLPSYPSSYLHQKKATLPALYMPLRPKPPTVWLKAKETRALFKALKGGLLIESGFVSLSWLKQVSKLDPHLFIQKLYAIAVLEVWMRLFIDIPISKRSPDISIDELLSIKR